jgi:hypothetical protein
MAVCNQQCGLTAALSSKCVLHRLIQGDVVVAFEALCVTAAVLTSKGAMRRLAQDGVMAACQVLCGMVAAVLSKSTLRRLTRGYMTATHEVLCGKAAVLSSKGALYRLTQRGATAACEKLGGIAVARALDCLIQRGVTTAFVVLCGAAAALLPNGTLCRLKQGDITAWCADLCGMVAALSSMGALCRLNREEGMVVHKVLYGCAAALSSMETRCRLIRGNVMAVSAWWLGTAAALSSTGTPCHLTQGDVMAVSEIQCGLAVVLSLKGAMRRLTQVDVTAARQALCRTAAALSSRDAWCQWTRRDTTAECEGLCWCVTALSSMKTWRRLILEYVMAVYAWRLETAVALLPTGTLCRLTQGHVAAASELRRGTAAAQSPKCTLCCLTQGNITAACGVLYVMIVALMLKLGVPITGATGVSATRSMAIAATGLSEFGITAIAGSGEAGLSLCIFAAIGVLDPGFTAITVIGISESGVTIIVATGRACASCQVRVWIMGSSQVHDGVCGSPRANAWVGGSFRINERVGGSLQIEWVDCSIQTKRIGGSLNFRVRDRVGSGLLVRVHEFVSGNSRAKVCVGGSSRAHDCVFGSHQVKRWAAHSPRVCRRAGGSPRVGPGHQSARGAGLRIQVHVSYGPIESIGLALVFAPGRLPSGGKYGTAEHTPGAKSSSIRTCQLSPSLLEMSVEHFVESITWFDFVTLVLWIESFLFLSVFVQVAVLHHQLFTSYSLCRNSSPFAWNYRARRRAQHWSDYFWREIKVIQLGLLVFCILLRAGDNLLDQTVNRFLILSIATNMSSRKVFANAGAKQVRPGEDDFEEDDGGAAGAGGNVAASTPKVPSSRKKREGKKQPAYEAAGADGKAALGGNRKEEHDPALLLRAKDFLDKVSREDGEDVKGQFEAGFQGIGDERNARIGAMLAIRGRQNNRRGDRGLSVGIVEDSLVIHGFPKLSTVESAVEILCAIEPELDRFQMITNACSFGNYLDAEGRKRNSASFRFDNVRITQKLYDFIEGSDLPEGHAAHALYCERRLNTELKMDMRKPKPVQALLRSLQIAKITFAEATRIIGHFVDESLSATEFRGKVVAVRLNESKREHGRLVPCSYAEGKVSIFLEDRATKEALKNKSPAPNISVCGTPVEFEEAMSRENMSRFNRLRVEDQSRRMLAEATASEAKIHSLSVIRVSMNIEPNAKLPRMTCAKMEQLVADSLGGVERHGIISVALQFDPSTTTVLLSGEVVIWVQDVDEDRPLANALTQLLNPSTRKAKGLDDMVRSRSKDQIRSITVTGECSVEVCRLDDRGQAVVEVVLVTAQTLHDDLSRVLLHEGPLVMPQKTKAGGRICFKANAAKKTTPTPMEDWESFSEVYPDDSEPIDIRDKFPAPYGLSAEALYEVLATRTVDVYADKWCNKDVYVLYHPLNNPYKSRAIAAMDFD